MTAPHNMKVPARWNGFTTDYPRHRCVHELFQEVARAHPAELALIFGHERVTYGELNARANQLAHCLLSLGVGPDIPVGICFERSVHMIVAMLAILKAGGAYVPLDPRYPAARLSFMIADAGLGVILTDSASQAKLPSSPARTLLLDAAAGLWTEFSRARYLRCRGSPQSRLHHIYLRLDRPSEGRDGRASRRRPPRPQHRLRQLRRRATIPATRANLIRRVDLRNLGRALERRQPRRHAARRTFAREHRRRDLAPSRDDCLLHARAVQRAGRQSRRPTYPAQANHRRRRRRLAAPLPDRARPSSELHAHQRLRTHREHRLRRLLPGLARKRRGSIDSDRIPNREHERLHPRLRSRARRHRRHRRALPWRRRTRARLPELPRI